MKLKIFIIFIFIARWNLYSAESSLYNLNETVQTSEVFKRVNQLMEGFNPQTDVIFFDWDHTIVGEYPEPNMPRSIRCWQTLELFKKLRNEHPGRAFILSAGNMFLCDNDGESSILDHAQWYTPKGFEGKELFGQWEEIHYRYITYNKENSIDNYFFYYPFAHAFCTPAEYCNPDLMDSEVKGYNLESVLSVLGFNSNNPLRRVYFVDDNADVIKWMQEALEILVEDGVVQEQLHSAYVPFYNLIR